MIRWIETVRWFWRTATSLACLSSTPMSTSSPFTLSTTGRWRRWLFKMHRVWGWNHLHQVPHPSFHHQVHLPLTEFAPFFRGQQVEDAPPLDLAQVISLNFTPIFERLYKQFVFFFYQIGAFGLQTFGGVYDDFKQSGVGSLEIDSISLYWAFLVNNPICTFEEIVLTKVWLETGVVLSHCK